MIEDDDDERLGGLPDLEQEPEDKAKKKRRSRKEKDAAEKLSVAYMQVMSTEAGRLVFYDRLDKAGYWLIPYDPASPHNTAYLVGNNAAARELYDDLWATSPDLVLTMLKENRT